MANNENKTRPTDGSVVDYLNSIAPARRREDAFTLLALCERITGLEPTLWGTSIVGFGQYHYRNASGREGDFMLTGFAPRKAAMSIYIMPGFKSFEQQLNRLGKHRHTVSCLYVTNLANIDMTILEAIISLSVEEMKHRYPDWKP